MISLRSLLEIGKRAIFAHQYSMNVTAHNIANALTPGYSRQRTMLSSTDPSWDGKFILGTGVVAEGAFRVRDGFVDSMVWRERSTMGYFDRQESLYGEIESIFGDLTENGFSQEIVDFFNAFQELANAPENTSQRVVLRDAAVGLAGEINRFYDQLLDSVANINTSVEDSVNTINDYASQIAELNEQIVEAEVSGGSANDLRDRRDNLIDQISEIAAVSVYEHGDGSVDVTMQGYTLVSWNQAYELRTVEGFDAGHRTVEVRGSGLQNIEIGEGTLKADLEVRDREIPGLLSQLDEFAATLIAEVNAIHTTGYGIDDPPTNGIDFFTGTDARSIAVNDVIVQDVSLIAASSDGSPGNGDIALQIADLQFTNVLDNDTATFTGFFNGILSGVGSKASQAADDADRQASVLLMMENRRSAVSGVSLNEENANLILQQNAFQAASRLIQVVDEMMDEIINLTR
jgi:flagellar hook-associated protein 1 FlgK